MSNNNAHALRTSVMGLRVSHGDWRMTHGLAKRSTREDPPSTPHKRILTVRQWQPAHRDSGLALFGFVWVRTTVVDGGGKPWQAREKFSLLEDLTKCR